MVAMEKAFYIPFSIVIIPGGLFIPIATLSGLSEAYMPPTAHTTPTCLYP